ncbi:hypothetical protein NKDENANG_01048 [Candidatus Entotheonellaceae bacterium PAL068K]
MRVPSNPMPPQHTTLTRGRCLPANLQALPRVTCARSGCASKPGRLSLCQLLGAPRANIDAEERFFPGSKDIFELLFGKTDVLPRPQPEMQFDFVAVSERASHDHFIRRRFYLKRPILHLFTTGKMAKHILRQVRVLFHRISPLSLFPEIG